MTLREQLAAIKTPMTVDQAAKVIGLHPQTIYKWTRQGKMPSLKLGGAVRIDPSQLAAWVEARQIGF